MNMHNCTVSAIKNPRIEDQEEKGGNCAIVHLLDLRFPFCVYHKLEKEEIGYHSVCNTSNVLLAFTGEVDVTLFSASPRFARRLAGTASKSSFFCSLASLVSML